MANPLQFWINHRKSLGSPSWMTNLTLSLFLLDAALITAALLWTPLSVAYCIQCALYVALLLSAHFGVHHLPSVRDEFFVRKQFGFEVAVLYLGAVLWTITLSLWYCSSSTNHWSSSSMSNGNLSDLRITDNSMRIAVRLLLDGGPTLTALLLMVAQFAIPLFRFEAGMDRLSNRNLFQSTQSQRRKLKVSMFECMVDRDGYYLFMEHLMGEYSVENLLFLTEVAFMKRKFEKSHVITHGDGAGGHRDSQSHSVASSIKNVLHSLSDRKFSTESASSTPPPRPTAQRTNASRSRKSTVGARVSRLKTIESSKAIVASQLEVQEIMEDLDDRSKSKESPSLSPTPDPLDLPTMEMAVINGKSLTFDGNLFQYPLRQKPGDRGSKVDGRPSAHPRLPDLPHSVTLAESMKQDNLYDAVDMIYDNFVDKKATHQINISSGVWMQITSIIKQHRAAVKRQRQNSAVAVVSGIDIAIFDEASSEIMALLRSSFYRFALTKPFKVYCTALGKL